MGQPANVVHFVEFFNCDIDVKLIFTIFVQGALLKVKYIAKIHKATHQWKPVCTVVQASPHFMFLNSCFSSILKKQAWE